MSLIDTSRIQTINPSLAIGDNAINDMHTVGAARNYKKYVASRYRLYGEKDIKYLEGDQLRVSTKLDGQLHFLIKQGDECALFNIKGRVITALPWLDEAQQSLQKFNTIILAGELYCKSDSRGRVYDVTTALSTKASALESASLAFAVFDIVQLEEESARSLPFDKKEKILADITPQAGLFHRVAWQISSADGISKLFNRVVTEGGEEGLVCVDEANQSVYKIKPRHNIDAVILGYTESPDTPDSLRVLLVGLMRPDGSYQMLAKVGTGFDDDQRREFFRLLKPMTVASTFNITDRNHTLFTMVRPEIIIEMAFHDVIYENASGRPEMKPVLEYSSSEGYQTKLAEAFVSILGATFKRIREDKEVNASDLRLTQLQDFVDLDNLEASARSLDYANSVILHREVYTKTAKGRTSVRKFITWKTNKDDVDPNYPAYAFCFVDYSPSRKAPLKRVLRTAPTEATLSEIIARFKQAEIKSGWKLAE